MVEKRKKIILGFTGRIDSVICAHLLKKQGHEVIGVGVCFGGSALDGKAIKNLDGDDLERAQDIIALDIGNLQKVKQVAESLSIPFYAVDSHQIYKDRLKDFFVASFIEGSSFALLPMAHKLLIEVLCSKMESLKAEQVCTGHYAKLKYSMINKSQSLYCSNDPQDDQSFYLSYLDGKYFDVLYFPLSEMRKQEVVKIQEKGRLSIITDPRPFSQNLNPENTKRFLQERFAPSLSKEGNVYNPYQDINVTDHEGIFQYSIGNKYEGIRTANMVSEDYYVVGKNYSSGLVRVMESSKIRIDFIKLMDVRLAKDLDLSRPMECLVKFENNLKFYGVKFFYLNNQSCFIEFKNPDEIQFPIVLGHYVGLFARQGKGIRVYGGGVVQKAGNIDLMQFKSYLTKEEEDREDNFADQLNPFKLQF